MTKYILHGGMLRHSNELNQKFLSEIVSSLSSGDKLLLCYFAPSTTRQYSEEEKFKDGVEMFEKQSGDKKLNYVFAKQENFIDQLREADAIYIHGGDTAKLFETLRKFPEFPAEIKKKKLVAGSSAGAYVLAKHYVSSSNERQEAIEMFGILPIKIICHFEDRLGTLVDEKFNRADPGNELEPVILRDCEMRIFER